MSIELPKDAEGREIPLDTVVLFGGNDNAYNIVRWIYTTDFETWSESNTWRAIAENHRALDPELMYLTPPDSWEKLEEDLSEISKGTVCHYFHKGDSNACEGCPAAGTGSCWPTMARDITSRIRKLRGED